MFLNIKISKATPERALKYATEKNILETTNARNLITSKSPAEEMRDTAMRFGKWQNQKDRKTFSLVISPNPKDNPTRGQVMEITEAVLDHFFPAIQGIIVLHKDKGKDSHKTNPVLHSHFYGSLIDPVSGKNIHLSDTDIHRIRAWADEYAMRKYNWRPFKRESNGKAKSYKNQMRKNLMRKGKSSWVEKLKCNIADAYNQAKSFNEFCSLLKEKGISVLQEEETKELKFEILVKSKRCQLNTKTIGDYLCWDKLQQKFMNENNRRNEYGGRKRTSETPEQTKMGASYPGIDVSGSRAGESAGTGLIGKQHKINYACIICTKDKDICRRCTEYKHRELGHGSRSL